MPSEETEPSIDWVTTKVNLHVEDTFTGVLKIENKVDQSTSFMLAYKTKIVGFSLNSSGKIDWVVNTGTSFVWKIIPNSLEEDDITGAYVSLSNGSILALSVNGSITWRRNVSNEALSSLDLLEDTNGDFLVVTGGDGGRLFWLDHSGSILSNVTINSEITLMKTEGNFLVVGTRSGEYYAYEGVSLLWNKTLSQHPCLAMDLAHGRLIVYNYGGKITFLELTTGTESIKLDFGVVVLDFLRFSEENDELVYMAFTSGELILYNITNMGVVWRSDSLYPTSIGFFEFTGDANTDLIIGSARGEIRLMNQSTGMIIKSQEVIPNAVDIVEIMAINYDNNHITDLIVFGFNGEVWVVTGLDLTPPEIIGLQFVKVSYNSYKISINASEEVRLEVNYGVEHFEQTISKPDFLTNHVLYLTNLRSDTKYLIQLKIWDRTGNLQTSKVIEIKTSSPELPYLLIFVALVITIAIGSISFGMMKHKQRQREIAYSEALLAQKENNFTKAIQLFHKANAGDEIVELVETILRDPSLAEEAGRILQMKEVESYLESMKNIIKEAKESQ